MSVSEWPVLEQVPTVEVGSTTPGLASAGSMASQVSRTLAQAKVLDGAVCCIVSKGTERTTAGDIARAGQVSRATLYRVFPGGKSAIYAALVEREVARLFVALGTAMQEADNLEDMLVLGICTTARWLRDHAVLQYLLEQEPGMILPMLAFSNMDSLLHLVGSFSVSYFARWLDTGESERAVEWAVRIVISHLICPEDATDLCLEAHTRRIARNFVLPGIRSLGPTRSLDPV